VAHNRLLKGISPFTVPARREDGSVRRRHATIIAARRWAVLADIHPPELAAGRRLQPADELARVAVTVEAHPARFGPAAVQQDGPIVESHDSAAVSARTRVAVVGP